MSYTAPNWSLVGAKAPLELGFSSSQGEPGLRRSGGVGTGRLQAGPVTGGHIHRKIHRIAHKVSVLAACTLLYDTFCHTDKFGKVRASLVYS